LADGLQVSTTSFRVGLQSYFKITTIGMKQSTLQHKEAIMLCEESTITTEARSALLVLQSIKQAVPAKTQSNIGNTDKHCTNCGMRNHNVETCRNNKEQTMVATTEVAQPSQKT